MFGYSYIIYNKKIYSSNASILLQMNILVNTRSNSDYFVPWIAPDFFFFSSHRILSYVKGKIANYLKLYNCNNDY